MTVKVEGIKELAVELDGMASEHLMGKQLDKALLVVEEAARKKAPKDSGALRRSITSDRTGLTGMVFTPLEYAPYIEYGTGKFAENGGRKDVPWHYQDDEGNWHTTSGQHPHPFMRPALDENREKVTRILEEGLLND
jgi:HK97 gp10 family phage protein